MLYWWNYVKSGCAIARFHCNFPHPYMNYHLGPSQSPQLLQYNFRLMDKFDHDLLNEYMRWLKTREAFQEDVLGILKSFINTCKYIRQNTCWGVTPGPFDFMDVSEPYLDPNECILAKYARYERKSVFFKIKNVHCELLVKIMNYVSLQNWIV